MTAPQYTPGPWTWTTASAGPEDEYGCRGRGPIDMGAFKAVGYYDNPELYGADGEAVLSAGGGEYSPIHGATHTQEVANARLIAAAPDMAEALRPYACVPCEYRGNIHCTMLPASDRRLCGPCAARAALAKAGV